MRKLTRILIGCALVGATTLVASAPAAAATTEQYMYHRSGAQAHAGSVWYNAGTHNPGKGRNSFTVKDELCGDGWISFVYYEVKELNTDRTVKSGQVIAPTCGEHSESIWVNPANLRIRWVPALKFPSTGQEDYRYWRNDVVR